MKKFKFSLEKVLNIREFEEEQAKVELGKAISETERLKRLLEGIASEKVKSNKMRSNSVDLNYLMSIEKYMEGLDIQKDLVLEQLAQAELVVEEKRENLTKAMQKRKALEKLKEKQLAQYKKEEEREEENILNDLKTAKKSD